MPSNTPRSLSGLKILVVDDEETVAGLIQSMLTRLGYRVTTKVSSLEAFDAFKADPYAFDILMTDMAMPEMTAPEGFKACQVTDVGGIDDKSFNATAWKGVQDAMADFGIEGAYLESQQQTDYEKNIKAFIDEGCNIIVTVGFLLGDATAVAGEGNPDYSRCGEACRMSGHHSIRMGQSGSRLIPGIRVSR